MKHDYVYVTDFFNFIFFVVPKQYDIGRDLYSVFLLTFLLFGLPLVVCGVSFVNLFQERVPSFFQKNRKRRFYKITFDLRIRVTRRGLSDWTTNLPIILQSERRRNDSQLKFFFFFFPPPGLVTMENKDTVQVEGPW